LIKKEGKPENDHFDYFEFRNDCLDFQDILNDHLDF